MTKLSITRLVVGEPRKLTLGRPVRQKLRGATGAVLRWRAGSWEDARAPRPSWLQRLLARARPKPIVVPTVAAKGAGTSAGGRLQRLGLAGAGALVFAAGAGLGLGALPDPSHHDPGGLPVAPAATVRVVQSTYVPAQQDAVESLPQEQPLPIGKPQPDDAAPALPLTPPAPAAAKAAERVVAQEAPKPAAKPEQKAVEATRPAPPAPAKPAAARQEPQAIPAVILDEAAPRAGRYPAPAASTPAPAALPVKQAALAAPAAPPVVKPVTEAGGGLIAITPDGKVAVFTHPKTKLPQQFQIGEQLPGGDTIRSIDAKGGKVVTSMKEYSLD